jgi:isochorismate hydrolase
MKQIYFNRDTIRTLSLDIIDEANILVSKKREQEWDKDNSALIVLDMQDYFINYNSLAYIPASPAIIQNINDLIFSFSRRNLPVFFTKHTNNKKNNGLMSAWWKRIIAPEDPLSAINHQIVRPDDSVVIEKHQYDTFEGTKLESMLKAKVVNNLVITGVMTNLCCETTARSAFMKGISSIMVVDATAAHNYEFHRASCINLAFGFSILKMTEDIIGELGE